MNYIFQNIFFFFPAVLRKTDFKNGKELSTEKVLFMFNSDQFRKAWSNWLNVMCSWQEKHTNRNFRIFRVGKMTFTRTFRRAINASRKTMARDNSLRICFAYSKSTSIAAVNSFKNNDSEPRTPSTFVSVEEAQRDLYVTRMVALYQHRLSSSFRFPRCLWKSSRWWFHFHHGDIKIWGFISTITIKNSHYSNIFSLQFSCKIEFNIGRVV